ncbi:S8 family serine peptidase [Gemmatimonas groenlandica]|uniref:S8 family serine peptidase n=1 Tax=Gemmatimonas groenlandica TaxID=2732249 RepID=A0A6M4IPP0_9BACT|nr:S8 family serine peptidase [Gemmatimonas groenlandica]QJR35406.1 S8 family serine peptidase [Gemmatimonas groenlandica]
MRPSRPLARLLPLALPLALPFVLALGACARAGVTTAPEPAMQPVMQAPIQVAPPPPTPAAADTARADWQRLDFDTDRVMGVGSERAIRELLASRAPRRRVVVAVVDGGVDTAHTRLTGSLWKNPREIAGNGKDDDGNGVVDDVFGWNALATADGTPVRYDTFELTRLYAACRNQPAGSLTPKPSTTACSDLASAYRDKAKEVKSTLLQVENIDEILRTVERLLGTALNGAPVTRASVTVLRPVSADVEEAKRMWLRLDADGLNAGEIAKAREAYDSQAKYALDTLFNPRSPQRVVGTRDVTGPDASHGTHVAGIIGALRGDGAAMQGIAPNVDIMAVRAVPDGDERDVDVARAIRYAVDNGAQIVNMSFGKGYSPAKASVDSAVRYAESKGVLLVHAAGNEGENNDETPSFPTPVLSGGTRAANWIEVGASSWKPLASLPAEFSNYGREQVDLFAPGVDILSTVPGGGLKRESGTSMAAPVVSGVAALLLAYFPELTAMQVRDILLESVRKLPDLEVRRPGDGSKVKFTTLSRTGGVIDAYAAVKLALQRVAPRP